MSTAVADPVLLQRIEELQQTVTSLQNQISPPAFVPSNKFRKEEVSAWLDEKPKPWQFFSAKAGTSILLHPDRIADNSESRHLASEHLPALQLEFMPWDSYGSEFPDPGHEDGRTLRMGVACLQHVSGITITDEDILLYEFPDGVRPQPGVIWRNEPYYTVERVIEMIHAKIRGYRGEDRELVMTGEQFRMKLRPMYESRWAIEDVNERNKKLSASMADDAWKRGVKPAAKAEGKAGK